MSDTAAGILSSPKILIHGPADIQDVELPQHSRIRPLLRCHPLVCAGNQHYIEALTLFNGFSLLRVACIFISKLSLSLRLSRHLVE